MAEPFSVLEVLLRGGAVGAFAGLAIVCARGRPSPARITGILFCLSAAAHTLTQYQPIEDAVFWAWWIVWPFSAVGAGFFWLFVTELFADRPRLEPLRLAPAFALLLLALAGNNAGPPLRGAFWLAHNFVGAALMAHILYVVWSGWRNDLVESRRRLRGPMIAIGAVYVIALVIVQTGEILWRPADALSPLAAFTLFGLGLAAIGVLLRADADLFAPSAPHSKVSAAAPDGQGAPPALAGEDARIAARLRSYMAEDRLYREEGLSVGGLAGKLGVPEHRLRRLINQQLGFRNFSAFLNEWRLGDAKQGLADPTQVAVPISTIALDAGFQSLGPFNRAFKADTGLTPTAFRASALAAASRSALIEGAPASA